MKGAKEGPRPVAVRQLPKWSELRPMLGAKTKPLNRDVRAAAAAESVADLRRTAARRVPKPVFDYVDGGAESEVTLARARAAFTAVEFVPRVLRDVETVSTRVDILGVPARMPVVLAPTGFTRLVHHLGEVAVVAAAQRSEVPYVLSTMGTCSIEEIERAAPDANRWFQLYIWRDRRASASLMARAHDAGCPVLVVTVDVPTGGARLRDLRNGFTLSLIHI